MRVILVYVILSVMSLAALLTMLTVGISPPLIAVFAMLAFVYVAITSALVYGLLRAMYEHMESRDDLQG